MANYLILGASRGLGAALVEGLPRKGDAVFGLSRGKPDWLGRKSAVKRHWIEADLSELSAVQNARVVLGKTPIDALIHVAGIWDPGTFDEIYDDEIDEILDVDLRAFLAFARGVAPIMPRSSPSARPADWRTATVPQSPTPPRNSACAAPAMLCASISARPASR
jgi:short-subunit dehydrogenase